MRLVGLYAIAALLALAVQTAAPLMLPGRFLVPNLIMILAVDLGLRHHGAVAALTAFMMGYATDATSGTRVGVNAFLVTVVYLLSYEVSRRLLVTTGLVGALAVLVAAFVTGLAAAAMAGGDGSMAAIGAVAPWVAIQAFITAAIAPMVFAILARLKQAIGLPAGAARE
ncbi:MAG: rod shape-determining protein MreD [Candidatus Binataceae bacterium]